MGQWGFALNTSGVLMAVPAAAACGAFAAPHHACVRWHQGDTRFIIELMRLSEDGMPMGQVADLDWGLLYAPVPTASILARGYWEQLDKPIDAADVLAKVRAVT